MRIDELGLNRFIEGLVAGQAGLCAAMLDHYLSRQTPVIDLYKYLFQPALYRIGELWKQHQISVSTEHMATAIIEGLMSELYPRLLTAPRRSLKAVIAFIEGELHQVGGKMVADVFVMNGWDVHYLGTNTPTSEVVRMVAVQKPHVVGLSLSTHTHLPQLAKTLDLLHGRYPKLPLLVGGQGFSGAGADMIANFPNTRLIETLDQLNQFAADFVPDNGDAA